MTGVARELSARKDTGGVQMTVKMIGAWIVNEHYRKEIMLYRQKSVTLVRSLMAGVSKYARII